MREGICTSRRHISVVTWVQNTFHRERKQGRPATPGAAANYKGFLDR